MRRYLFFITKPYALAIIQPLLAEIERSARGESLIYATYSLASQLPNDLSKTSNIKAAIRFHPDVVFAPGNFIHDRLPGLKVQIFHGLCDEKGGHYRITSFFDLYCTSGPMITANFLRLVQRRGHFAVVETGWPKIDALLQPFNRNELASRLKLDPLRRSILYAPTFSPRFKSSDRIFPFLQDLPRDDEQWIIKFHDLMHPVDQERFNTLPPDRFRIFSDPDITPLLQLADVLISDTSSVVYEFMLLDKPVITIDARSRLEKGLNVTNLKDLRAALDFSFQDPKAYAPNRRAVMQQIHPYHDTTSSARVLAAVDEALAINLKSTLKPKPPNLFRKWQVRRWYGGWL
jgi:hypothetical protein